MPRTYKTIPGLTYQNLDAALKHLGYVREDQPEEVIYRYPDAEKAVLVFSPRSGSEEVRGVDVLAARSVIDGFDLMAAKDFDLLLLRLSGTPLPALTR